MGAEGWRAGGPQPLGGRGEPHLRGAAPVLPEAGLGGCARARTAPTSRPTRPPGAIGFTGVDAGGVSRSRVMSRLIGAGPPLFRARRVISKARMVFYNWSRMFAARRSSWLCAALTDPEPTGQDPLGTGLPTSVRKRAPKHGAQRTARGVRRLCFACGGAWCPHQPSLVRRPLETAWLVEPPRAAARRSWDRDRDRDRYPTASSPT
jgi:hypothetical protein